MQFMASPHLRDIKGLSARPSTRKSKSGGRLVGQAAGAEASPPYSTFLIRKSLLGSLRRINKMKMATNFKAARKLAARSSAERTWPPIADWFRALGTTTVVPVRRSAYSSEENYAPLPRQYTGARATVYNMMSKRSCLTGRCSLAWTVLCKMPDGTKTHWRMTVAGYSSRKLLGGTGIKYTPSCYASSKHTA